MPPFTLYQDEDRAMRPTETEIRSFVMYFKGSLRGLSAGAPVELHGIAVGEVKSLDVEYDRDAGSCAFPLWSISIRSEYADARRARARCG
jgi:paraquat-inducible protein B